MQMRCGMMRCVTINFRLENCSKTNSFLKKKMHLFDFFTAHLFIIITKIVNSMLKSHKEKSSNS